MNFIVKKALKTKFEKSLKEYAEAINKFRKETKFESSYIDAQVQMFKYSARKVQVGLDEINKEQPDENKIEKILIDLKWLKK